MSVSKHTEAQIVGAVKQVEAGRKAEDVAREVGVSKHALYSWKAKYGGMEVSEAQEAKQLRDAVAAEAPPVIDVPAEVRGEEIVITLGDRHYRVRGLAKNRAVFVKQAALEMQDEQIKKALDPKPVAVAINDEDRAAALELLRDPDLTGRILRDFELCGVVGEETNKLTGYIAAVSRHLETPLAVILQSRSAAGKSSLMESILAFLPEEHRIEYSAMTGQSLFYMGFYTGFYTGFYMGFYMGETDLKNKVLAIVEEEGASRGNSRRAGVPGRSRGKFRVFPNGTRLAVSPLTPLGRYTVPSLIQSILARR